MEKNNWIRRFWSWREKNISNRNFILITCAFIGIAAGISAYFLKTGVFYLRKLLISELQFDYHNFLILIYPSIGIALSVLLMKYIVRDPVKHNITMILRAISRRNSIMKVHKIFSSLLGGIFTAGFGGSIGLESPIISSGAAIGSNIGRNLKQDYKTNTLLLACGAAGAIAAIFNTPVAGVVFALEVLLIDLTRFSLIPLLMSSATGAITTKILYREEVLFDFKPVDTFSIGDVPFFIILAILAALLSWYFTGTYLYFEKKFEALKQRRYRLLTGSISLGVILFLFPPLWGEGFETIKNLLNDNYTQILNNSPFYFLKNNFWAITLFFLILSLLKVVAMSITIGAGGVGGIFAPSLFSGAILGFIFAFLFNSVGLDNQLSTSNFILVGMGAVLTGVLHAPLTSLFLIAEITSGYELIVPLMLVNSITFVIVKYLEPDSIITKQLAKKGELITHHKDKAVLSFMKLENIIEKDFLTVNVNATLGDLIKIVSKSHRNIFPAVDDENKLAGLVELDHIREIMFQPEMYETTAVSNLMVFPPAVIYTTDTMPEVIEKFNETDAWNLPVLQDEKYIGFISKSKMFSEYRKKLVDISAE